jgi:hypothetical protein
VGLKAEKEVGKKKRVPLPNAHLSIEAYGDIVLL